MRIPFMLSGRFLCFAALVTACALSFAQRFQWTAGPPLPESAREGSAVRASGMWNSDLVVFAGGRAWGLAAGASAWADLGAAPGIRESDSVAFSSSLGVSIRQDRGAALVITRRGNALSFVEKPVEHSESIGAPADFLGERLYLCRQRSGPERHISLFSLIPGAENVEPVEQGVAPIRGIPWALTAQDGALLLVTSTGAAMYSPSLGWSVVEAPPAPIGFQAATAYGQAHVFTVTTENRLQAFHTITQRWADFGDVPEGGPYRIHAGGESLLLLDKKTGALWLGKPAQREERFGGFDLGVIGVYFLSLIAMGVYFSKRETSTDAFFLGGRRVPWWAVGISIFSTSLSAITFLAIPAAAYAGNWVSALVNVGIVLIAPFVIYLYLPHFRKQSITTAYEFLEIRFNLAARIYGSVMFFLFQIGRVSIVLFLPSMALSAATGIDVWLCIAGMGVVTTLYTVLGGIEAVVWTDVVQAFVLGFGAIMAFVLVNLNTSAAPGELAAQAWAAGKFHMLDWTWDMTTTSVWVCVVGNLFLMAYPYTADQTTVQRYLLTATEKDAARAVWVNAILTIPVTVLFFGLGTALWAYYREHPAALDPSLPNDAILPLFVVQRFPAGLGGVLIAALFAASMSSLDSSLNAMSSVLVTDYVRRFNKRLRERTALFLARWLTCLFGILGTVTALFVAEMDLKSMFEAYNRMLGLVGGGLAGMMALAVFSKRATGNGAIAGAAASAVALYTVRENTSIHSYLYPMIAFGVSAAAGWITSIVLGGAARTAGAR